MKKGQIVQVRNFLLHQKEHMVDYLDTLVRYETPSTVPESQKAIMHRLEESLKSVRYAVFEQPGLRSGGYLYARPIVRKKNQPIQLLIGHCDTVWPEGTIDSMRPEQENGLYRGPGAFDMKAGLTQIVFALQALMELDLDPQVTPVVLINSDEEIGSHDSTRAIRRLARIADRAFVMEPPVGPEGLVKTARKGIGRFTLTVRGRSAHAGLDPGKGASAIVELSHQIQRLFALNDHEKGITVNVGMIEGGVSPNVVAPESKAVVDVRVLTPKDAELITRAIHALEPVLENTELLVEGAIGRPPMMKTTRNAVLWDAARREARKMDVDLKDITAGGGSDGNTTSQYCATLDGLGTIGDGAHAKHEFIEIDKLVERTLLLALLIMMPPVKSIKS